MHVKLLRYPAHRFGLSPVSEWQATPKLVLIVLGQDHVLLSAALGAVLRTSKQGVHAAAALLLCLYRQASMCNNPNKK